MKLELGFIEIKDIQFSNESKVENGTLFVNADDVKAFVYEDDDVKACVKSVCFDIAKPGESVRITPVKDVIEPRVKVEGPGGEFPGVIAKVDTVGSGKTHVLRGMAVVTAGPIVGFQEGIIDMTGPGAEYTPFSKLLNLVMVCTQVEGVHQHEYEHAVRIAGLRAATFIGELGRNVTPDETKEYETLGIREGLEKYPNLPRVGYVHMLQSQGLLHDTYVYGVDAKRTLTTIIYPTETMDGAIISGNCVSACDKNTTYHHQNNPVVADLFEQHGKTLNYVCNIITNENVYLADKQRSSDWSAEYAGQDGKSQSLADADPLADAVVTGGNANMVIELPKLDKVIGTLDYVDKIAGGHAGSLRPDGSIEAELQVITGATNEMGFNCLSAR